MSAEFVQSVEAILRTSPEADRVRPRFLRMIERQRRGARLDFVRNEHSKVKLEIERLNAALDGLYFIAGTDDALEDRLLAEKSQAEGRAHYLMEELRAINDAQLGDDFFVE